MFSFCNWLLLAFVILGSPGFGAKTTPTQLADQIMEKVKSSTDSEPHWLSVFLERLSNEHDDNAVKQAAAQIVLKRYDEFITAIDKTKPNAFTSIMTLCNRAADEALKKYNSPHGIVSGEAKRVAAVDGAIQLILLRAKRNFSVEPMILEMAERIKPRLESSEYFNIFFLLQTHGKAPTPDLFKSGSGDAKIAAEAWSQFNFKGAQEVIIKIGAGTIDDAFCRILDEATKYVGNDKKAKIFEDTLTRLQIADAQGNKEARTKSETKSKSLVATFFEKVHSSEFKHLSGEVVATLMSMIDAAEGKEGAMIPNEATVKLLAEFMLQKKFAAGDRYKATIKFFQLLDRLGEFAKHSLLCNQSPVTAAHGDFLEVVEKGDLKICLAVLERDFNGKIPADIKACMIGFK